MSCGWFLATENRIVQKLVQKKTIGMILLEENIVASLSFFFPKLKRHTCPLFFITSEIPYGIKAKSY